MGGTIDGISGTDTTHEERLAAANAQKRKRDEEEREKEREKTEDAQTTLDILDSNELTTETRKHLITQLQNQRDELDNQINSELDEMRANGDADLADLGEETIARTQSVSIVENQARDQMIREHGYEPPPLIGLDLFATDWEEQREELYDDVLDQMVNDGVITQTQADAATVTDRTQSRFADLGTQRYMIGRSIEEANSPNATEPNNERQGTMEPPALLAP